MSKTMLLAVDAARDNPSDHVAAAAAMTRELSRDTGDKVIVLHVHEFAVGRFGRIQVDCAEGEGENVVQAIVSDLQSAGITVEGQIRKADLGHIARAILAAADEVNARLVVLGSSSRTDLPHMPFGSVSNRLLHLARRPVLIVPKKYVAAAEPDHEATGQLSATGATS